MLTNYIFFKKKGGGRISSLLQLFLWLGFNLNVKRGMSIYIYICVCTSGSSWPNAAFYVSPLKCDTHTSKSQQQDLEEKEDGQHFSCFSTCTLTRNACSCQSQQVRVKVMKQFAATYHMCVVEGVDEAVWCCIIGKKWKGRRPFDRPMCNSCRLSHKYTSCLALSLSS